MIWNLDRFTTQYITGGPESVWLFLLLFLGIPLIIYFAIIAAVKKNIKIAKEAIEEEEEPDGVGDAVID